MLMTGDWQGGVIACNDVWNNSPGNYVLLNQQTGETTYDGAYDQTGKNGNISVDPMFLNASFGKDYHIVFGSPCINAGDPQYVPSAGATTSTATRGSMPLGSTSAPTSTSVTSSPFRPRGLTSTSSIRLSL